MSPSFGLLLQVCLRCKKYVVPLRCVLVGSGLFLLTHFVYASGSYQRTKDGKTLVWNNYPLPRDEATWSGERDAEGYATGPGTLTWFSVDWTGRSDSNTPPPQRPMVINRYTGNMVRGKFEGPVVNLDSNGKSVQLTFENGRRVRETSADSDEDETVEAPTPTPAAEETLKDRALTELNEQMESVLAQVGNATGNFHEIARLDLVQELPVTISESIGSLVERTREWRAKIGSQTAALPEYRTEITAVDALSLLKQVSRDIAMSDAAEANSKLADFFQSSPEPLVESQQPLWHYLRSLQTLCGRLEKQAAIHLQRAQSLAAANKTNEAIREYQEAYRTFPNPATAGKIRQLQDNSLGL
jgi:hypothetical protein